MTPFVRNGCGHHARHGRRSALVVSPLFLLLLFFFLLLQSSTVAAALLAAVKEDDDSSSSSATVVTCVNGGHFDGTKCVCPIYYSGADCSERQCPNSKGGTGPYHILPVNSSTKFCDHCDSTRFDGLGCQICQSDDACKQYTGRDSHCNRKIAIRGDNKQFQCRLDSPYFIHLMGDGRNITAEIVMNCSTPDGSAFSTSDAGQCAMAIYRIEPDREYVDPFFRCEATNCTMRYGEADNHDDEDSPLKRFFRVVRVVGQVELILLCVALAGLGGFASRLGPKRMRIATLTLAGVITVSVLLYIILMAASMHSVNPVRTLIYDCAHTNCACAEDPPSRYQPICSESDMLNKYILPTIKNNIRFVCEENTNICTLTLTDLTLVFSAICDPSECVDEDRFPADPSKKRSKSWGEVVAQNVVGLLSLLAVLGCFGLVLNCLYMHYRSQSLAKDFLVMFHLTYQGAGDDEDDEESTSSDDVAAALRNEQWASADGGTSPAPSAPAAAATRPSPGVDDADEQQQQPLLAPRENSSEQVRWLPHVDSYQSNDGGRSSMAAVRASLLRRRALLQPADRARIEEVRRLTRSPLELVVSNLHYALVGSRLAAREDALNLVILNQINFTVRSGEVLAIMGPSGAGKTTLLDLLSARSKAGEVSGSVALNGTPVLTDHLHSAQYRNIIGYVSQEDTLIPTLTVRQTIEYAARLKLPRAFSHRAIRRITTRMIQVLKLQRCEHTLIGDGANVRGVSGGEKRRVSIAVELLANPRLLFLDEPTSGLDAVSAKRVVEAVVALAKDSPMRMYAPYYFAFKPIVIFSIHQPSQEIYELFDKILLLSRGVSVYCGRAKTAATTMEVRVQNVYGQTRELPRREDHHNHGEYLMKLEEVFDDNARSELQDEDMRANGLCRPTLSAPADTSAAEDAGDSASGATAHIARQLYTTAVDGEEADPSFPASAQRSVVSTAAPSGTGGPENGEEILQATTEFRIYYANVYQQLWLLISRSATALIGSFHLVICHAAVVACMATLMCFLYRQQALDLPGALNRAGSVSFLLLVTSFVSLSCLEQLIVERKLFVIERENGFYTTFPYLLSRIAVDIIPLRIIPAAVLASIIYFPMGFRVDSGTHFLWFVTIVVLFAVAMTLIVLCIGIVSGSFGAAALLSSVCILWNFVFGGALVQAGTIPMLLRPFQALSPFFLAFESLMVNELNGQNCIFSPTDETGKPSSTSIPILCVQYLANEGLQPTRFNQDVLQLALYIFGFVLLAWFLLARYTTLVR